jgi:hypothetical protein
MKTQLTCHLVRGWKGIFGSSVPHEGIGAGHIAGCPACQAYFAASSELTAALRRGAVEQRQDAPAGFDLRVLAALNEPAPRRAPRERHVGRLVLAFGGVAAAVALVFVPLSRRPRSHVENTVPAGNTAAMPVPATLNPIPALDASVNAVLAKEPLQQEVHSVYADARSAVRFLEMNFLPDAPTDANGRSPSS